jgi:hypothetical protein
MATYTSQLLTGEAGTLAAGIKAQVEKHGNAGWRLHTVVPVNDPGNGNAVVLIWEK